MKKGTLLALFVGSLVVSSMIAAQGTSVLDVAVVTAPRATVIKAKQYLPGGRIVAKFTSPINMAQQWHVIAHRRRQKKSEIKRASAIIRSIVEKIEAKLAKPAATLPGTKLIEIKVVCGVKELKDWTGHPNTRYKIDFSYKSRAHGECMIFSKKHEDHKEAENVSVLIKYIDNALNP